MSLLCQTSVACVARVCVCVWDSTVAGQRFFLLCTRCLICRHNTSCITNQAFCVCASWSMPAIVTPGLVLAAADALIAAIFAREHNTNITGLSPFAADFFPSILFPFSFGKCNGKKNYINWTCKGWTASTGGHNSVHLNDNGMSASCFSQHTLTRAIITSERANSLLRETYNTQKALFSAV